MIAIIITHGNANTAEIQYLKTAETMTTRYVSIAALTIITAAKTAAT